MPRYGMQAGRAFSEGYAETAFVAGTGGILW